MLCVILYCLCRESLWRDTAGPYSVKKVDRVVLRTLVFRNSNVVSSSVANCVLSSVCVNKIVLVCFSVLAASVARQVF